MASKPTQRSLEYLRRTGWMVCIVEKFLPARGDMKFPRRIDAFNFGDLLACIYPHEYFPKGAMKRRTDHVPAIALVQTTDHSSFSKHKDKLMAMPEVREWKAAGGLVVLHGWGKRGPRGQRKVWTLREEIL